MAASASIANPCLVAILLVIQQRSGSGSRLVFHYPPEPLSDEEEAAPAGDSSSPNELSDSSSSDGDSSTEEVVYNIGQGSGDRNRQRGGLNNVKDSGGDQEQLKSDEQYDDDKWKPSWEPLLGFGSHGLASLLSAGPIWHKKKFELGINDLCFLGRPVFGRGHGFWRKNRRRRDEQKRYNLSDQALDDRVRDKESDIEDELADESVDVEDKTLDSERSELSMFNLVFVLDPPTLEHDMRVKDMYQHVVKDFSRALQVEQTRNDFVWKESKVIQSVKARHFAQHSPIKTLYTELLTKSPLAAAIASVYRAISTSKIASFNLSASTSLVLQIPLVASISVLPSLTDPPVPAGLWLTTFNDATPSSAEIEGLAATSAAQLAKHVTLLLKETPQRIIKDAQAAGGPLAVPLTKFVAAVKPTKSFHKIAATSQISWNDTQLLASHLIMWRRAMVIPPLHQRDTYYVSPNADMSKLKVACKAYSATFPTLPDLATILAALSDTPRSWMMLVPSSDHKEAYYDILAWLMKGGWVTQLRTFAYVRVSAQVKSAVREHEKRVEQENTTLEDQSRNVERKSNAKTEIDDQDEDAKTNGATESQSFYSSENSRRPSLMSRPSSDHRPQNGGSKITHDPSAASIILNPSRASPLESKWLEHIGSSFLTTAYSSHELTGEERMELRTYWFRFVKYFNGCEPLEFIPVREGLKRKFVWDLLSKMGLDFDSAIETPAQQNQARENKKILVTIRHW